MIELVAADVQILELPAHARELGGGGATQAVLARGFQGLRHAVDGVVVGQRHQPEAGRRRVGDDVGGRQRAVGGDGVRLQVERLWHVCVHDRPGTLWGDRFPRNRRGKRMSTGLIIAIVVIVLILLALIVLLPRMRANSARQKAERELGSRRERAVDEHRNEAADREAAAEEAEQRARMAKAAAEKERAEANVQSERANMHERGMADSELVEDHERERFADVPDSTVDRDADGHTIDDRAREATGAEAAGPDDRSDYEQGRVDERERITDDVRESDRRS